MGVGSVLFFMTWYYLKTGINAKDMFGERGYVELESGLSDEQVRERVKEEYPKFSSGQFVKSCSVMDWDVDSQSFDDVDEFLSALGEVVGSASNHAYSLEFGRVSTNEAHRKA